MMKRKNMILKNNKVTQFTYSSNGEDRKATFLFTDNKGNVSLQELIVTDAQIQRLFDESGKVYDEIPDFTYTLPDEDEYEKED